LGVLFCHTEMENNNFYMKSEYRNPTSDIRLLMTNI
jgi:hypothetical protein